MPTLDSNMKNIILNSAGGKCNIQSISVNIGKEFTLPTPTRRGYVFEGWFTRVTDGEKITDGDTSIVKYDELYARWTLEETKILQNRKQISLKKRQQRTLIALIIAVVILAIALSVVNYIVDIYRFEDLNGDVYYIKKDSDGDYALYHKGGGVCDKSSDGYFLTDLGTQLKINAGSGDIEDIIYVDDINYMHKDEIRGASGRLLMFKQMTYDHYATADKSKVIKSIEVTNMHGGYAFVRDESMNFVIRGREDLAYDAESFAMLASACGYTLSMATLDSPKTLSDGSIDFAEYGLVAETRTKIELDDEGKEIETKYNYTPATYKITAMTGEYHIVTVGDEIVSGQGYYAKYSGGMVLDKSGNLVPVAPRDRIYILGNSGLSDVLSPIETLITPMIIYPMSQNSYYDVADFVILTDIDYAAIELEFNALYADDIKDMTAEEVEKYFESHPELQKKYAEIFEKYSKKICDFTYAELEERENSMYATLPYVSHIEYSAGYYINSSNIDNMLYKLASMKFIEVVKLNPTDEELAKYKLDNSKYYIEFLYHEAANDTDENKSYVYNAVSVSEKNADGNYYAYSDIYDMIVLVEPGYFDFLEWDESKWYDTQYVQLDIGYITNILIESPKLEANISFDNTGSDIATYVYGTGNLFTDGKNNQFNIQLNPNDKYSLFKSGVEMSPIYRGDYMLGSVPYVKGTPENDYFILMETTEGDQNQDGESDTILHYGYNVIYSGGTYILAATAALTDLSGNQIGNNTTINGEILHKTEYFVTTSGQVFFASKSSSMGKILTEKYKDVNLGTWCSGNVFVTANGQYILINSANGEWAKIDAFSCRVYFGDRKTSALAKNAVRVEARYDATGKMIAPEEYYYATGSDKIRYNYEGGYVEVYKSSKKAWEAAAASDYTTGVWLSGSYFVTENRDFVLIDENSGDWGVMSPTETNTQSAVVYVDGNLLSYEFDTVTQSGMTVTRNEVYNFRQFYKGLLYASLEGIADLTDEEMQAFREMDNFTEGGANNPCILKITILAKDLYGNERNVVYRFYQYSERRAYITIEILDGDGESNSNEAYGSFYVLSSFAQKIISDAQRLIDGVEISSTSKY